jgi:hypothetical protein
VRLASHGRRAPDPKGHSDGAQIATIAAQAGRDRGTGQTVRSWAANNSANSRLQHLTLRRPFHEHAHASQAPAVARQNAALRRDADRRVAEAKAKLDDEKGKLDARLKALTRGVAGV